MVTSRDRDDYDRRKGSKKPSKTRPRRENSTESIMDGFIAQIEKSIFARTLARANEATLGESKTKTETKHRRKHTREPSPLPSSSSEESEEVEYLSYEEDSELEKTPPKKAHSKNSRHEFDDEDNKPKKDYSSRSRPRGRDSRSRSLFSPEDLRKFQEKCALKRISDKVEDDSITELNPAAPASKPHDNVEYDALDARKPGSQKVTFRLLPSLVADRSGNSRPSRGVPARDYGRSALNDRPAERRRARSPLPTQTPSRPVPGSLQDGIARLRADDRSRERRLRERGE